VAVKVALHAQEVIACQPVVTCRQCLAATGWEFPIHAQTTCSGSAQLKDLSLPTPSWHVNMSIEAGLIGVA
jgi:hypothetical protein